MFQKSKHVWFLLIAVSFALQAATLNAQLCRRHWYTDPLYPAISSASSTRSTMFEHLTLGSEDLPFGLSNYSVSANHMACASNAGPSMVMAQGMNDAVMGIASPLHGGMQMQHARFVRTGNAILKLWISDGLHVEINGKVTKPQHLAGVHRDSRIFSLTGLKYDEFSPCEIVVYQDRGKHLYKYGHIRSVVAGESYVARYPHDFRQTSPPPRPHKLPPPPTYNPSHSPHPSMVHPPFHGQPNLHHGHGQFNKRHGRVTEGLQVLYTFTEKSGNVINDRSDAGKPINLHIEKKSSVTWVQDSPGLVVHSRSVIKTAAPAMRLIEAVRDSEEFTIEAWIHTNKVKQPRSGPPPARIVTLSKDSSERNFTLGQEDNYFQVRLRTTAKMNKNGLQGQELRSPPGTVRDKLLHVVYTRDKKDVATIYINGQVQKSMRVTGDFYNWNGFHLGLANEMSSNLQKMKDPEDRSWFGTYYLVAIYSRALSPADVERNCRSKF